MGNRLSKIVTRKGDQGYTELADGTQRRKDDRRIHCLGQVDELNAMLGLLISLIKSQDIAETLLTVQHDLFDLGAELSLPGKTLIGKQHLAGIDQAVLSLGENLPPLKEFILPGGSQLLATAHLARTVCRRAERSLVALHETETINPSSLVYVNRLSDLLFITARCLARKSGHPEVYWQSHHSRVKPS